MSATTSLKQPDALARQQFYADGQASCLGSLHSNRVYAAADVKAYVMARAGGGLAHKPWTPQSPSPAHDCAALWRAGGTGHRQADL
jgi:hypothetical protein